MPKDAPLAPAELDELHNHLSSVWTCLRMGCLSGLTVEPCLFFFALCNGMFVIIAQNLYIAKVCEVNLGFDKVICDNITHNKEEQVAVQKYVSELQAYSGVLQVERMKSFIFFSSNFLFQQAISQEESRLFLSNLTTQILELILETGILIFLQR